MAECAEGGSHDYEEIGSEENKDGSLTVWMQCRKCGDVTSKVG